MAQVSVTINARNFKIACEDGQEAHLAMLAEYLSGKVGELVAEVGQIGDTRLLLMAGLLVADELVDTREELALLREGVATPDGAATQNGAAATPADDSAAAASLQSLAQRIDAIAVGLERT